METAEKNLVYLYCVTNKLPELKEITNLSDSFRLYSVCYQGIYAVVSKVKESEFGEHNLKKNMADLEWIKEKAGTHENVIEGVMEYAPVIPFKLATLFNTEDSLKAMLEEHAQGLSENFRHLEGKEEWGIKIYCDMEGLRLSVIKDDPEMVRLEEEINSSSAGKAFLLKKKKQGLIEDLTNNRINEDGKVCFEILKGCCFEARLNRLLPKEVTEREEEMILNSAFLIEKCKVADFLQTADGLKEKYKHKGLSFDCTGPWPPYNFCKF